MPKLSVINKIENSMPNLKNYVKVQTCQTNVSCRFDLLGILQHFQSIGKFTAEK